MAAVVLVLVANVVEASRSSGMNMMDVATYEHVQALAKEQDLLAASQYVTSLGDDTAVADAFSQLIGDVHYKAKSTEQVLHFGHAGVQYCLTRAATPQDTDNKKAGDLRYAAKRMATNVASFTWPGWREPGITVTDTQLAEGLTFARAAVRMAKEQKLEPTKLAFTTWFLGAQLLANGKYDEALKVFNENAERYAAIGGQPESLAMNQGYAGLARILAGESQVGDKAFDEAIKALKAMDGEDAPFYAKQLEDVRGYFMENPAE